MSVVAESLDLLRRFAGRGPLPRVRALHLPPPPPPGGMRGEFCALELDDGSLGLSYVLLDDTLARLREQDASLGLAGADALEVAHSLAGAAGPQRAIGLAASTAAHGRAGFANFEPGTGVGAANDE